MTVVFIGGPADGRDDPTSSSASTGWSTTGSWGTCAARGTGCVDLFDATYRHMERVDGEALRDTDAWRAWAQARPALTIESTEA